MEKVHFTTLKLEKNTQEISFKTIEKVMGIIIEKIMENTKENGKMIFQKVRELENIHAEKFILDNGLKGNDKEEGPFYGAMEIHTLELGMMITFMERAFFQRKMDQLNLGDGKMEPLLNGSSLKLLEMKYKTLQTNKAVEHIPRTSTFNRVQLGQLQEQKKDGGYERLF